MPIASITAYVIAVALITFRVTGAPFAVCFVILVGIRVAVEESANAEY